MGGLGIPNFDRAPTQQTMAQQAIFESVIQYGAGAIKSATLINGGAAVALLANISNKLISVPGFKWSLSFFVIGTLTGALASGTAYLAQYSVHSGDLHNYNRWKNWTWGLVSCSYISFAIGTIISIFSLQ